MTTGSNIIESIFNLDKWIEYCVVNGLMGRSQCYISEKKIKGMLCYVESLLEYNGHDIWICQQSRKINFNAEEE